MKHNSKVGFVASISIFSTTVLLSIGFGIFALNSCNNVRKQSIEFFTTKPENIDTLNKIAEIFEKEHNGTIHVKVEAPINASDVLKARLTRGDYPDIIAAGGNSAFSEFQARDLLLNLSGEKIISKVKPVYLKMLQELDRDGSTRVYGVPYSANVSGILCNTQIFEDAGIPIPLTWSELLSTMEKLKKKGIKPFEFTFCDEWTTLPVWNSMVSAAIPNEFVDLKVEGNASFAETHTEILEKFLELLKRNGTTDFTSVNYQDGNRHFARGDAAMLINGNWAIPEIKKTNPDIKLDLIPFPTFDNIRMNTVTSGLDVVLAIPKKKVSNHETLEFLEFLMRPDIVQLYSEEQFSISTLKDSPGSENFMLNINRYAMEGRIADYPDHYYPSEFGSFLSFTLFQFTQNYLKGIPDENNIRVTLLELDNAFDRMNP